MIRAVLDTNVLVSAFISVHGAPRQIFNAWRNGEFELITCASLLQELNRVLHYARVQEEYGLTEAEIYAYLGLLRIVGTIVPIPDVVPAICSDPTDDKLLACAVVGGADYVVTGNNHVLVLSNVGPAQIVTPAAFATAILGGWQLSLPGIQ